MPDLKVYRPNEKEDIILFRLVEENEEVYLEVVARNGKVLSTLLAISKSGDITLFHNNVEKRHKFFNYDVDGYIKTHKE